MTLPSPHLLPLLALALAGPAHADEPLDGQAALDLGGSLPVREQLWLGHTWVGSQRELPVLGTLETRTDTWVLARVIDHGDRLEIEQRPCAMEIKPVAGVRVGMDPAAVPDLPAARFTLLDTGDGGLEALAWTTGWDEEDLDRDGEPGVTMRVRSALCGGRLQVASQARSTAQARRGAGGLEGTIEVDVGQRILDASGACLRMAARDSTDTVRGRFRYTPAPVGATCASVPLDAWPQASDAPR